MKSSATFAMHFLALLSLLLAPISAQPPCSGCVGAATQTSGGAHNGIIIQFIENGSPDGECEYGYEDCLGFDCAFNGIVKVTNTSGGPVTWYDHEDVFINTIPHNGTDQKIIQTIGMPCFIGLTFPTFFVYAGEAEVGALEFTCSACGW